jgi:flavodoxin
MSSLLIIYHSHTGNTEAMAKAISDSATASGAKVTMKKALEASPDDLTKYDVVIFGSPNEFGRMCGLLQDFFERTWLSTGNNPGNVKYTAFTSGGSSQRTALESIENTLNSINRNKPLKFTRICDGVCGVRAQQSEALAACRELGKKIATL